MLNTTLCENLMQEQERLLDKAFEELDHKMFEEDRENLDLYGTTMPDTNEEDDTPTLWAVNSAGHRYNPRPRVTFHHFFLTDDGHRMACFTFAGRNHRKYAIIDRDLYYKPLIGKTVRVTMIQEPDQWYITDPKAPAKPQQTYQFSKSDLEQLANLKA